MNKMSVSLRGKLTSEVIAYCRLFSYNCRRTSEEFTCVILRTKRKLQDRHIKHIEKMEERHKLEMKNIQEVYNAKLEKLETDIGYLKEKMLTDSENRLIDGKQEESMVYSEGNVSVTNSPSPSKRLRQLTEQNNTNGSVVSQNIENAEQGHENQKTLSESIRFTIFYTLSIFFKS